MISLVTSKNTISKRSSLILILLRPKSVRDQKLIPILKYSRAAARLRGLTQHTHYRVASYSEITAAIAGPSNLLNTAI